jgi:hypothetical protein
MTIISSIRVKPLLLSFFLIFVSISLLLSIWFIIKLLSDFSETLYGDATLSCFHLLPVILGRFFSFARALMQFACQQRATAAKEYPAKI